MADAENKDNVSGVDTSKGNVDSNDNKDEAKNVEVNQDPQKVIDELKAQLAKTEEILAKARRGEKDNQSKRKELEQQLKELGDDDLKTKYEQATNELNDLRSAVKNNLIDSALKDELAKANVKSVSTVMKLVDRSKINVNDGKVDTKSIEAVIEDLKKTDSVLFQEIATPAVKRSGEAQPIASFKTEMKAATTPAEVQRVLAKYGMGSTI